MQLCKIRPMEDLNFFNGDSYFRRANFLKVFKIKSSKGYIEL